MSGTDYPPIRVSYSILSSWARGDIDRAVAPFVGEEVLPTLAMIEGKMLHEKWERETLRTGRMPKVFGGRKLESPELELATKKARQLNDWCVISGVLDLREGPLGVDYKSGVRTATEYANSFQHKVYQVLYPELERFEYHCFNQHLPRKHPDRVTMAIVHLSRQTLEDGINYILTYASELRQYLIDQGYGDRLARKESL